MSNEKSLPAARLEQKPLSAADFVLSRNPERAMQEMMEAIAALRAIYAEETKFLTALDTKAFVALQPRKNAAIAKYQAGIQQIIARREEFKKTKPESRVQLITMQEEFFALTSVNLKALDVLNKSVQRLGNRIMLAARKAVQKNGVNYSKSGNMANGERIVSIGINQSA